MIGRQDRTEHRKKFGPERLWSMMITKTLAPGDPLAHSPPAIKAIIDKLMDLREHNVRDESNPVETSEVASRELEAHIVRVFAIVGIKDYENNAPRSTRAASWRKETRSRRRLGNRRSFRRSKLSQPPWQLVESSS